MNEWESEDMHTEDSSDVIMSTNSSNLSPQPAPRPRPQNTRRGLCGLSTIRTLGFSDEDTCRPAPESSSPPYKRVQAMNILGSSTPQSIWAREHMPNLSSLTENLLNSTLGSQLDLTTTLTCQSDDLINLTNVNPFSITGQEMMNRKRSNLSKTSSDGHSSSELPTKRLKESNISRLNIEFVEKSVIGTGQFGRVTRSVNRLDGCEYAIKRSLRPVTGSFVEKLALNEVYALSVLDKHPNIVRYYSAWAEDDHMVIQNEYCDGGSLEDMIEKSPLPESELLIVLKHITAGLRYIHSMHLAHMDLKPANILISAAHHPIDPVDEGSDEHEQKPSHYYKIGDLGHVTMASSPEVEEGDCRYLPKEILADAFTDITKCDIFSFGLTLFEAGGGGPLPHNGELWHAYRDGKLPDLPQLSEEFNQLLKSMVAPEPADRPSALQVMKHALLQPRANPNVTQLSRELAAAKQANALLEQKVQEMSKCLQAMTPTKVDQKVPRRTGSLKVAESRKSSKVLERAYNSLRVSTLAKNSTAAELKTVEAVARRAKYALTRNTDVRRTFIVKRNKANQTEAFIETNASGSARGKENIAVSNLPIVSMKPAEFNTDDAAARRAKYALSRDSNIRKTYIVKGKAKQHIVGTGTNTSGINRGKEAEVRHSLRLNASSSNTAMNTTKELNRSPIVTSPDTGANGTHKTEANNNCKGSTKGKKEKKKSIWSKLKHPFK